MAGIGILQTTSSQIENTHKERYEHEGVVALAYRTVDRFNNEFGRGMRHRCAAEHTSCHSHYQCGRYTFACHVADAEVQLLVADEEVEEVATHLLGRHHLAIDIDIGTLRERWIHLRQHSLLDVTGNL